MILWHQYHVLFLIQKIIERFYKIQIGTVLVIATPQIINGNNKTNQNNNNNKYKNNDINISLKIEESEQILVIGKSRDFGFQQK